MTGPGAWPSGQSRLATMACVHAQPRELSKIICASSITATSMGLFVPTISIVLEGRTVTMGLAASHKIWVYDPARPVERPTARRARARRGH